MKTSVYFVVSKKQFLNYIENCYMKELKVDRKTTKSKTDRDATRSSKNSLGTIKKSKGRTTNTEPKASSKKSGTANGIEKSKIRFLNQCLKYTTASTAYDYIEYKLGLLSTSVGIGPEEAGYQIRAALREMLEKNVSRESIIDLVKVVEMDMLFYTMMVVEGRFIEKCNWALYFLDKNGNPTHRIQEEELSTMVDVLAEKDMLPKLVEEKRRKHKPKRQR